MGTSDSRYRPDVSLTAVLETCVMESTIVSLTPGMPKPDGSITVPVNVALSGSALTTAAMSRIVANRTIDRKTGMSAFVVRILMVFPLDSQRLDLALHR